MRAALVLLAACSSPPSAPRAARVPLHVTGHIADGRTVMVDARDAIDTIADGPATTAWLWPPVIDSHVHLAYWAVADRLAAAGVEGAVDLAAPERTLGETSQIRVISAGPMLTHAGGYPLDAWGADGYGTGCADAACVTATVERLVTHGAGVLKIAGDDDGLDPALYGAVVTAAHARGVKVAIHSFSDASCAAAAAAGVDVLAHTPVERLSPATIAAWKGRAVISTLAAFGAQPSAIENLRALRAAGATVLYGTDLGNLRDPGISADELVALASAGLDAAAITAAMTTAPAAFWGFPFGIAPGREATFLELTGDPRDDVGRLTTPTAIYVRGQRVSR